MIIATDKLRLDQQDLAASERGYLLTGKQVFIDQFHLSRSRIGPDLDNLERLTADNPAQQRRLDELHAETTPAGIRRVIDEMRATEGTLLTGRERSSARQTVVTQSVILGGVGLAFIFIALSLVAIRRELAAR